MSDERVKELTVYGSIYIDGKPEVALDRKHRPKNGAIHCYAPEFMDEPGSGVSFDRDHLVHLCVNCAELCDAHYVEGYDGDCVECELCGRQENCMDIVQSMAGIARPNWSKIELMDSNAIIIGDGVEAMRVLLKNGRINSSVAEDQSACTGK